MFAQLQILRDLRRDEAKFRRAVESHWTTISRRCNGNRYVLALLSPSFLMQYSGISYEAIADEHGMAVAIAYMHMYPRSEGSYPLFGQTKLSLADVTAAKELSLFLTGNIIGPVTEADILSWASDNPHITRDLYDHLVARGQPVTDYSQALYGDTDNPVVGYNPRTYWTWYPIPVDMPVPPSFVRLSTDRQLALGRQNLIRVYLLVSQTSPQELWDSVTHYRLLRRTHLKDYLMNPTIAMSSKVCTIELILKLPIAITGRDEHSKQPRDSSKSQSTYDDYLEQCEFVRSAIWYIPDYMPWIDYTDYLIYLDLCKRFDRQAPSIYRKVVGAPISWWREQESWWARQFRTRIAIERGLPGTVDELIARLHRPRTMAFIRQTLEAYKLVRTCYRQRLVKMIVQHWRALTKRGRCG